MARDPLAFDLSSVTAVDLLGNGTACLVWSSALPGNGQRQMRYIALMEEKPHLLDAPDQFDSERIRLADIDGSGTPRSSPTRG